MESRTKVLIETNPILGETYTHNYDLYSQDYINGLRKILSQINDNIDIEALIMRNVAPRQRTINQKFGAKIIAIIGGKSKLIKIMNDL